MRKIIKTYLYNDFKTVLFFCSDYINNKVFKINDLKHLY